MLTFEAGKAIEEEMDAHFAGEPSLHQCYATLHRVAGEVSTRGRRMDQEELAKRITDLAHSFSCAAREANQRAMETHLMGRR